MVLVDQHAHPAGEMARAVGQQLDLFQPEVLAPLVHHEGVVDRQAVDLVHAGGLEHVVEPLIVRALLVAAGRGECNR